MRGIIPQPLGQMREYAGHLSRQSILDFSLSSCACSLWHSPPLHSDPSWLNRLFYFINIHYMTWSCMATEPGVAKLHASHWGFSYLILPWTQLLSEKWYFIRLVFWIYALHAVLDPGAETVQADWSVAVFPVTFLTPNDRYILSFYTLNLYADEKFASWKKSHLLT